ncbi:MAG: branched-chain amino acid ABC transporter permease [Candidatus Caldarchaeum sp.]
MRITTPVMIAALLAALSTLPLYAPNDYYIHMAIVISIYAISASALNIMMGYLGLLPLCVAAFMGVGAYTSANLTMRFGVPFPLALLASALMAGFGALLLAVPSFRTKGIYYIIVTIGFQIIITEVYQNLTDITGGSIGIRNIPKPSVGPFVFTSKVEVYYLYLAITLAIHAALFVLLKTHLGRSLTAIRENEPKATVMGVNSYTHKLFAFSLSMALSAIAGSLYAHYMSHVSSDNFTLLNSIDYFLMVTIGGPGTFYGPVLGAVVWTFVMEALHAFRGLKELIYGIILVVIMLVMPKGTVGLLSNRRLVRLFRRGRAEKAYPPA